MLILFLSNILFLPIITGTAITSTTSNIQNDVKTLHSSSNTAVSNSAVPVPIITEGGSMVTTSPPTLLKRNLTNLLDLDKEINKEKFDQSSGSKVAPRKGVVFPGNSTVSTVIETPRLNSTTPSKTNSVNIKANLPVDKNLHMKNEVSQPIEKENKTTLSDSHNNAVNKTVQHKKPLLLSNEALDRMDIASESTKGSRIKQVETKPGVVMPVVITILVVPMFAVLGFMALRRGREAWKNRHYKRMDFLLDGMYNE